MGGKTVWGAADAHLNNNGEFVFWANFTDGTQAIVLATPSGPACTLPSITSVSASPAQIWPPNNKMVPVNIAYTGTSSCEASYSLSVTGSAADRTVVDAHNAMLRATKDAVYT